MAHARVVAIGIDVAAAGIGKGGRAIHVLLTGGDLNVEVLRVINVIGRVDVDAADRVDERLHAIEADLGIVRNLHAAQFVDRLDHGLGAAVGVAGVDFHGRTVVDDLGITRNGDERRLLLRGIDTRQDNRVGAVCILARATVSAKE